MKTKGNLMTNRVFSDLCPFKKKVTLWLLFFMLLGSAIYAQVAPPVDLTFYGLTSDQKNVHFKIKVNSEKPIRQVDIGLKILDGQGKVLKTYTYQWQNIVPSPKTHGTEKEPIVKGKIYDVLKPDLVEAGAEKVEGKLGFVTFEDGSFWKPQN
jgi:hypothetical protein